MNTIGFIGLGNMAAAIVKGLIASGFAAPESMLGFCRTPERLAAFCRETGIRAASGNEQIVREADVVVLAVKPKMFPDVLPPLAAAASSTGPLVVSVAAGISLNNIAELLGREVAVVRAMPNVNARIGASMTGLCANEHVSAEQAAYVRQLFDALGRTMTLPEDMFSIFSAVAGASPAFAFMFIEGLAKAGLKAGMTKRDAVAAAAQAVMGSARLVLESGEHPMDLVDRVCSPGGTTIAGVAALEAHAFVGTTMLAVAETCRKDKELSQADGFRA